jgi:hypothetical protein
MKLLTRLTRAKNLKYILIKQGLFLEQYNVPLNGTVNRTGTV